MNYETQIKKWILADEQRMLALEYAASLKLPDWCLSAGFVRNLVWDKLHGYETITALNDIDLIYFDSENSDESVDLALEQKLNAMAVLPWSVKNQARMHVRNNDKPYSSTADAMSYWVEVETAIGVRLVSDGSLELVAPFGIDALFANTISINPKRQKQEDFYNRIHSKKWLENWPLLLIKN